MNNFNKIGFAFLLLLGCNSCIKQEDPCHGAKHIKADFYMQQVCTNSGCPAFWQNYTTTYSSGSSIQFTSSSFYNTSLMTSDTPTYEWHIGSGTYHGASFTLNFGSATNGSIIPVMLIIRQKPDSLCIPNDNGVDTVVKNLTIDQTTFFCYGTWKGAYTDSPMDTATILIAKDTSAWQPYAYIKYLYPDNIDTLMGDLNGREDFRQEISVGLGSNSYSIWGNAMTDSSGQNITIYYQYYLLPNITSAFTKTFKGKRI